MKGFGNGKERLWRNRGGVFFGIIADMKNEAKISRRGFVGGALAAGEVVKSPMPGNVLKINVTQGQQVKEGDVLLILEAMKMENEIASPKAGTVTQIVVAKGAVVETDAPLVVIG